MIDTHCHLTDKKYTDKSVIENYFENKNNKAIIVACEYVDFAPVKNICADYNNAFYTIGIHPHSAASYDENKLINAIDINDKKLVAIGEIGLDYFYDFSPRDSQKAAFDSQLKIAKQYNLPFVVHCRDAYEDCLQILKDNAPYKYGGIMHCFSGSAEWAKEVLKLGLYISFSGSVTFKKSTKLRETAKSIPIDRLLAETDSPYLSPEKYRGKINNPQYVEEVIAELANLHNVQCDEMSKILENNAENIFTKIKLHND